MSDLGRSLNAYVDWWRHCSGQRELHFREVDLVQTDSDVALNLDALRLSATNAVHAAVDSGANLLSFRVPAVAIPSIRALVAVLTGSEPDQLVHQHRQMPDREWMRTVSDCRDLAADVHPLRGEPEELAAALEAPALTAVAHALLTAAERRTAVLLEGATAWGGALMADRRAIRAKSWWHGAGSSADLAVGAAITRIGIPAGLDLALPTESSIGVEIHREVLVMALAHTA
jgi:hypothetical protein